MQRVILHCPVDECESCPALFRTGNTERPFAITDETDPRGTVNLTEAELHSLGTDAPLITVTVTVTGSDDSRVDMTTKYYQRLVDSIRDGSTQKAVEATTV